MAGEKSCSGGLDIRRIFTLDRRDFSTYRVDRGHYQAAFEIVP